MAAMRIPVKRHVVIEVTTWEHVPSNIKAADREAYVLENLQPLKSGECFGQCCVGDIDVLSQEVVNP